MLYSFMYTNKHVHKLYLYACTQIINILTNLIIKLTS